MIAPPASIDLYGVNVGGNLTIGPTYNFDSPKEQEGGYWFVPFANNPNFVGRDKELDEIFHFLHDAESNHLVGISGLGGVGKTQLAIEYAYRYRDQYSDGVFWLSGSGNLIQQLGEFSTLIGVSTRGRTLDQQAGLFWQYLLNHPKVLVVFDNLLDFSSLTVPFLPGSVLEAIPNHLIFTTRLRGFGGLYVERQLNSFSEPDALNLLAKKYKKETFLAKTSSEYIAAKDLCRVLGGLPLALDVAGSFLRENPEIKIADYYNRLLKQGVLNTLDSTELDLNINPTRHTTVISATLRLSWDSLQDKTARRLIFIIAQLPQSESIPLSTLSLLSEIPLRGEVGFPSPLLKSLRKLFSLSLVEEITGNSVHLHPLVFEFIQTLQLDAEYLNRIDFRMSLFENLQKTLGSVEKLEKYIVQHGDNSVLTDFQLGFYLHPSNQNPLLSMEKIVNHEAHALRGWSYTENPSFFAQRIHARAIRIGDEKIKTAAETLLARHNVPHIRLQWRSGHNEDNLIRTLTGHLDEVCAVAITPDGKKIISGSGSLDSSVYMILLGGSIETHQYVIKIWDYATGSEIRTIEGHSERIYKLAVTPDGSRVVSASADHTLKVWDVETGSLIHTLEGHVERVMAVVLYQDGRRAISGGWDETIKIWDLVEGKEVITLPGHSSERGFENYILSLAVTADESTLVSGSRDTTIKIWDLKTFEERKQLDGHLQSVLSLAIIPEKNTLISGSTSIDMLIEWDIETGLPIRSMRFGLGKQAKEIKILEGTDYLIIANNKDLILWNMTDDSHKIIGHHEKEIYSIAFVPQTNVIISASKDHTLKMWDVGRAIGQEKGEPQEKHTDSIRFLEVTADKRMIVSGSTHTTQNEALAKKSNQEMVEYSERKAALEFDKPGDELEYMRKNPMPGVPHDISLIFHEVDSGKTINRETFAWTKYFAVLLSRYAAYPSVTFSPDKTRAFLLPFGETDFDLFIAHNTSFLPQLASFDCYFKRLYFPLSEIPTSACLIPSAEKSSNSLLETFLKEFSSSYESGSYEEVLNLYKDRYRQRILFVPNKNQIITLQLFPSRQIFGVDIPIYTFCVSDFETGEIVHALFCDAESFAAKIEATIISPNGSYFAAFYMNNQFEVWSLETGNKLIMDQLGAPDVTGDIVEVLFSRDESQLIVRYEVGGIIVIRIKERKVEMGITKKRTDYLFEGGIRIESAIGKLAIFSDGKRYVETADENVIRVCELISNNEVARFIGDAPFRTLLPIEIDDHLMIYAGDESGTVWAFEFIDKAGS